MPVDLTSYLSIGLAIISINNTFPQPTGNSLKAIPGDFQFVLALAAPFNKVYNAETK